ncbi:PAAR domain-containing protein [Paenibacillus lutrae]|uniref:Uncharacterized protein n=1 Tax=Paenibacillus lutrae TaxID=2078573 RepID=A0A7X3FJK0_9BACL|nr:PAAR domain-containing protein [Paenibacillus lutrae]MVP00798.1 hypothetical protein [Paenibacillus lutrae]
MPGIAYHGCSIADSSKQGYVQYNYKVWDAYKEWICEDKTHPDGSPYKDCDWVGGYDEFSDSTEAAISGTVASSGNVYVNGNPIATTSSSTNETWQAGSMKPIVTSVSPGTSGTCTGNITNGSATVYANGSPVAYNGASVVTGLGSSSSITQGSHDVVVH